MANGRPEKQKKIAPTTTGNAYLEYVPHFTTQPQWAAYTINLGCCGDKSNASLQFSNDKTMKNVKQYRLLLSNGYSIQQAYSNVKQFDYNF